MAMNRLTIKDLQRVALHCGYRTDVAKPARLRAIAETGALYDAVLAGQSRTTPLNVLSVDVGIKNFSYSKVSYTAGKADIKDWTVKNLHDEFGTPGYTDEGSLVDSKAYMAKLAVSVVDNVLISDRFLPHIITIENQRTRSNTSKATLPNVLLNFTLEHMLYAAFHARQIHRLDLKQAVVVPTNSNKMVNFWLSRYTSNSCKYSPSRSKTYRKSVLYGWLKDPSIAPFDISSFTRKLPENFSSMGAGQSNNALRDVLEITRKNAKVDDLVDSLLYNIGTARQISHHTEIQKFHAADDKTGLLETLDKWDKEHIQFLEPLLSSRDDLYLAKEYEDS